MPPPAIRAEVIPDRTALRLSDSLRLDVTVEGPTPLRVEAPKEWLAEASSGLWKMQALGPPRLSDAPDGQRWTQSFRLDPYVPGSPVPLILSPVTVNGSELELPSFSIEVTTTVAKADVQEARPITGFEPLPPKPAEPTSTLTPILGAVAIAVAFGLIVYFRRRTKPVLLPTPLERATLALERLDPAGESFAQDLAEVLREWLEGTGVPAKSRTAAELRLEHPQREPILSVLERCDRSRYSGEVLALGDRLALKEEAVRSIGDAAPSAHPTEATP